MWTYSQTTGKMFSVLGEVLAIGYSGAPDSKNDPSKQDIPDHGPIPQGRYSLNAPIDTKTHGPYVLALTPDPTNQMFSRAGFMIHGDSVVDPGTASEGCICIARFARERMWESNDHLLTVVA